MIYHYCYLLTFPNGMKYVGAKSGSILPEHDTTYLGSGKLLPKDRHSYRHLIVKEILGVFNTREELLNFEENYIIQNNCVTSSEYYNQRKRVHDKHGCEGKTSFTKESRAKAIKTMKQRNYTYVSGNRTPAQKAHDDWCRLNFKGVKNPAKGHKGTSNCAFIPWYFIDPNGNYFEFTSLTKNEYAISINEMPKSFRSLFVENRQHKLVKKGKWKGYIFGNLPKP